MRQSARDLRLSGEALRETAVQASITTGYPASLEPAELRLVRETLADARLALDAREYERAHRLATQAIADARVAETRAETENLRRTARELRLNSEALRETAARLASFY
jgi:hypothetical protein